MQSFKVILLIFFSINCSFSQDENNKVMDDKSSLQVVNGRKEKRFDNVLTSGGFYDPYVLINYPELRWKISAILTSDNPEDGEKGVITFQQWNPNNIIRVDVNISGLTVGKHAVHIHEFGDISQGCNSTGSHMQKNFIGNIEAKEDGIVESTFLAPILTLFGFNGIIGRSVVIHEKPIEIKIQPEIFYSPYNFLPINSLPIQMEETQVGAIIACGPITIKSNQS